MFANNAIIIKDKENANSLGQLSHLAEATTVGKAMKTVKAHASAPWLVEVCWAAMAYNQVRGMWIQKKWGICDMWELEHVKFKKNKNHACMIMHGHSSHDFVFPFEQPLMMYLLHALTCCQNKPILPIGYLTPNTCSMNYRLKDLVNACRNLHMQNKHMEFTIR